MKDAATYRQLLVTQLAEERERETERRGKDESESKSKTGTETWTPPEYARDEANNG